VAGHEKLQTKAELIGDIQIPHGRKVFTFTDVLYHPSFSGLISSQRILGRQNLEETENGSWFNRWFTFRKGWAKLMIDEDKAIQLVEKNHVREWHERYAHLPFKAFSRIPEVPPDLINANLRCDACEKGKSTKLNSSAQKESVRTEAPLEIIYADLVGPMGTETYDGKKYLLNVMDDYTRIIFVAGLRKKSDAAIALIEIIEAAERQFEKGVKFLQTDQGGEFRSEELSKRKRCPAIVKRTLKLSELIGLL
jgi:hypothetical protein